jgi:hypothetical protein
MYNKWWNFSPRLGLAWDLAGDGRTSIRASVGTFYDFPNTDYLGGLNTGPPWVPRILRTNVSFADPWANEPGGDPFPLPHGRFVTRDAQWPLYGIVTALDYNSPNMQVAQWDLSLQKQVGTDWLLSASYLGNGTTHLWSIQHTNPGVFLGLGPCTINGVNYNPCSSNGNLDQRRRLSLDNPQTGKYYGFITRVDTGGTARYNGLILSVERRAARGVTIRGNYTWSHCISDPWQSSTNPGPAGDTNPDSRHFDRGNCTTSATDYRHLFNFSAVAATPRFSNSALRAFASGWRFSPIFKIISGDSMTITTSTDIALTGIGSQRVNQVLPNPYGNKSVNNYLNPAAFALPALGTYGNVGAASIAGPGTWQFDAAVSRTFQLREVQKVEFRAEAFNVTNAFRLNDPTTNLNSNTFGQVTSARDPRIMQFALKYFF